MLEFRKKEVEFQEKNSENLSLQRQQLEIKAKQNLYDKQKVKALKLISNEMKRQEVEIIQQIKNVQIVQDSYEIFKQNSDQMNQQDEDYYELIEQIIETQQQIDQFDLSDQK
ncbi:hypothetical protein PPERSA_04485 [Pseudocohnilembus persalinus]|uniref:Uncharacterized protein n=1 Tax=Pseudocohnilembus persalinus TaxID=266149 RepID=A0A0V0QQS6_PSEPJ|nr:hypothetical protein PPERSA_04485 [Pseudocohnilembus persalinus]|eukprot:KRX04670.1 hypothetical protein PPERSA_04485 [Pseudocohnilembus persalinus]